MKRISIGIVVTLILSVSPLYSQNEESTQSKKEARQERREERKEERQNSREERRQERETRKSNEPKTSEQENVIFEPIDEDEKKETVTPAIAPIERDTPKENIGQTQKASIPTPESIDVEKSIKAENKNEDSKDSNWLLWGIGIVIALIIVSYFKTIMGGISIICFILIGVYLYKNGLAYNAGVEWLVIIFILSTLIWYLMRIWAARCGKCKRLGAMKVYGRELVDEKASTITETRKKTNARGEVISKREVDVPATVRTYHIHRRCKKCGYEDYLVKESKTKN